MKKSFFAKVLSLLLATLMVAFSMSIVAVATDYDYMVEGQTYEFFWEAGAPRTNNMYFTPEVTGVYTFYSMGEGDTVGAILDSNGRWLTDGDNGGYEYYHFKITYEMKAGETYILNFGLNSPSLDTTYTVAIVGSDIASVEFDDVVIYKDLNAVTRITYNEMTGRNDLKWLKYSYKASGNIIYRDGRVERFENGTYQAETGEVHFASYIDGQDVYSQWIVGNSYEVTGKILGCSDTFNVTVADGVIDRVEVHPCSIMKETCGQLDGGWYWYSNISPEYTVYFKDGTIGTSVDGGKSIVYNGEHYSVICTVEDDQTPMNPWGVGEHTATLLIFGQEIDFTVEIIASPVVSVEVEDVILMEKTGGYYSTYWDEYRGEQTWYMYHYYPDYTITLNDGSTITASRYEGIEIGGQYYYVDMWDDQNYYNQWGIGEHTVNASFMGVETTFTVEIIESPVVSIEVEDVSIIEKTGGYYTNDWDEYGNEVMYYRYNYSPSYTITFKDGSTKTASRYESIEIGGQDYSLNIWDDQNYYNQWGIGEHTVNASFMGVETTFTVEIIESPVVSVHVNDVSMIQCADGYYNEYYDDYGNKKLWFRYYFAPEYTVVFEDGSSQSGRINYGPIKYNGTDFPVTLFDDQSQDNQWGVGKHSVGMEIGGVHTTFTVEVLESPIEKVIYEDLEIVEYLNARKQIEYNPETGIFDKLKYYYEYVPEYTVYMKDGTVLNSAGGFITYDGKRYDVYCYDAQETIDWGVGIHSVQAYLLGIESTFEVTVKENPYTAVEISGTNELILTFTKKDGGTERFEVLGGEYAKYSNDLILVYLNCGDNIFIAEILCSYTMDGAIDYEKGIRFRFGDMESNLLCNNMWLNAMITATGYEIVLNYTNHLHDGYAGVITEENLDAIIDVAFRIADAPWNYPTIELDGDYYIAVDMEAVERAIEKVFGITGTDLTKAGRYNEAYSKILLDAVGGYGGYDKSTKLYYENGNFIYESVAPDANYDHLKLFMDEEMHIIRIEVDGKAGSSVIKGDLDGDGSINAKDANIIKRIIAGVVSPDAAQSTAGDIDGNGYINGADAYLLKLIIIGEVD